MNEASIQRMEKSIAALKDEFNAIRTGRASAALFDKVRVDYYGQPTPLNQVATISVPEARSVAIRNIRRDGNDDLKKQQKDSKLTEDELKTAEDALQKSTDKFIADINKILETKEKEIMED